MPYLPCKSPPRCAVPALQETCVQLLLLLPARPRSGENVELVLEDEAATRSAVTLLVELAGMAHTQVTTQYKQIIKILYYFNSTASVS